MKLEILTPPPDGFILGRSLVGVGRLGSPSAAETWDDFLPQATTITVSRGGSTGHLNRLDGGRLAATFKGLDDLDLALTPGRAVRLRDDARGVVLFGGDLLDPITTDGRDYDLTTIVCTDVADTLANSPCSAAGVYGFEQTLGQRVAEVMGKTTAAVRVHGTDTPALLQANVHDADVGDHLTVACDSFEDAAWRPATDGAVDVFTDVAARPLVAFFTDDPADADLPSFASYTSVTVAYGTTDRIANVYDVTNHGRDAAGNAVDTTTTYTDITSAATYKRRKADVALSLTLDAVPLRAAELLAETSTVARVPTALTYRYGDLDVVLDLLDRVMVTRRGVWTTCAVVGITHTIQPVDGVHTVALTLKETS